MRTFEAREVRKRFEGVVALRNAFLVVEQSKICGLVGANGSGKSTFSKICTGLLKADSAELAIDGKNVTIDSYADADRHRIALVHQNLSLVPDLTVWQNIVLGKERSKGKVFLDSRGDKAFARDMLAILLPNGISPDAKVSTLPPGIKMLVEITKALSRRPELLILDEPTAALEYRQVEHLFRKISELKDQGVLLVFISHRIWEITRICDVVYAFRNGETVGVVDFSRQPRDERLVLPLVVGSDIEYSMEKKKHNSALQSAPVSLTVESIALKTKLRDVSFKAKKGEILGIGGLNGQGQEELMQVLSGAIRPTTGRMLLNGRDLHLSSVHRAVREGIYLVPGDRQRDGLFVHNDVFFNAIIPRFAMRKDGFVLDFAQLAEVTDGIIEKTALNPPNRKMVVSKLSGGNQQKVVFGKWLQFEPIVLVLNDPAKGIDIGAMQYLYSLVRELSASGTTVILYTSSNEELICNCDRVLIMYEGRVVKELGRDELSDENIVRFSLRIND
jgi:ribose transport system ATP-binding protein